LVGHQWSKARFPLSNGIMSGLKAPLEKHLGQIPQAQFVAQPPEDDEKDKIGGVFQIVEGSQLPHA
jgi:hypothetical protein